MNITSYPAYLAKKLAIQSLKDELNIIFNDEINIYKENSNIIKEEYVSCFYKYYYYFFRILVDSTSSLKNNTRAIIWSTEDFESKASAIFENIQNINLKEYPYTIDLGKSSEKYYRYIQENCSTWEDLFDKDKFLEVLDSMISKSDMNEGVTWFTVESYLWDYCIKKNITKGLEDYLSK